MRNKKKYILYLIVITLFCIYVLPSYANASERYNVAGKTYFIEDESGKISFGFLWYPTKSREKIVEISGIQLLIAQDAKIAEGIFPVVILLHGLLGDRFSFYVLANKLARLGYIVYAPSIKDFSKEGQSALYSNKIYSTYTSLLNTVIEKIESDKSISSQIKHGSIGVITYGISSLFSLRSMGVGVTDAEYKTICKKSKNSFCEKWIYKRLAINSADQRERIEKLYELIKGVVVLFPEYNIFLERNSLSKLTTSMLVVEHSINEDSFPKEVSNAKYINALPYENTDLECIYKLQNVLKICDKRSIKERKREIESLHSKILNFIQRTVY